MADTKRARQFGNIRRLSSGRYQARYRGPDGKLRPAPSTFQRKTDAARWLSLKETEISTGEWIAPELGAQVFREYAAHWMRDRVLKARTAELYDGLLTNHLFPAFGDLGLADIDEVTVRRWRKERLETGPKAERPFGPVTVAKAYRLLHAIFETAVEDHIVARNPCRIAGAGQEESDERAVVPLPVVFKLADTVPVRYRSLILLATFADMRWGELVGLRRENIDLDTCEIRITETLAQLDKGGLRPDTPKSRAGRRIVAFPAEIAPEIRWHLERFAEPGPRGFVFVGPEGRAAPPLELPPHLGEGPNFGRPAGSALPRSAAHRRHPHGHDRRHAQGAHGPARALQRPRGPDLPARHPRPGPGHRQGPRRVRTRSSRSRQGAGGQGRAR